MVIVALFLVVLMGMAALAVDLGMLQKTRAEAQRAADAVALAGASAFTTGDDNAAQGTEAIVRAKDLAIRNTMGGEPIDVADVGACDPPALPLDNDLTPPDDPTPDRTVVTCELAIVIWYPTATTPAKVRVRVRRAEVPVWFANIFGRQSFPVAAKAAAIASGAGASKCVLPVVFPDYWDENNSDTNLPDPNNNWPDDQQGKVKAEDWAWDDVPGTPDCYWRLGDPAPDPVPANPATCAAARAGSDPEGWGTGLGSDLRNGLQLTPGGPKYYRDVGRPVVIKPTGGNAPYAPSFYNLWDMPGGNSGGEDINDRIMNCDPDQVISLGTTYDSKPGSTTGPVEQGFKQRLNAADPTNAQWVETDTLGIYKTGHVAVTAGADWRQSPKVILVPLAHPKYVAVGRTDVQFNEFAFFWLEAVDKDVTVRFIGPAAGGLGGPVTGPLLKTVRLVE